MHKQLAGAGTELERLKAEKAEAEAAAARELAAIRAETGTTGFGKGRCGKNQHPMHWLPPKLRWRDWKKKRLSLPSAASEELSSLLAETNKLNAGENCCRKSVGQGAGCSKR